MDKELYYCEKCKKEFWLSKEDARKRGSLCPKNHQRNHQIFLGETEEEIKKRKKEFLEKKETVIKMTDEQIEEERRQYMEQMDRRGGGRSGDSDTVDLGFKV